MLTYHYVTSDHVENNLLIKLTYTTFNQACQSLKVITMWLTVFCVYVADFTSVWVVGKPSNMFVVFCSL